LGESFAALSSLRSDLHRAHEDLKLRAAELTSRRNTLSESLVDVSSKLEEAKRIKRSRAQAWNDEIVLSQVISRQAQLKAEYTSNQHQHSAANCSDYESSLHASQKLVADSLQKVEIESSDVTETNLHGALEQRKLCEDRLADLTTAIVPQLEVSMTEAARHYADCISRLRVVFKGAQKESSDNEEKANALVASQAQMAVKLTLTERHLDPASDLLRRFRVWLDNFDIYIEVAQSAEEWTNLVPTSCGDRTIDDHLRAALRRRNVLNRRLEAAQALVEAMLLNAGGSVGDEHAEMAVEDVRGHALLLQLAERHAKRMHVEYELVLRNPVSEDAVRAQQGNRPADLAIARAKKPTEPLARAAFLLSSASSTASAKALTLESKPPPRETKRKIKSGTSSFNSVFEPSKPQLPTGEGPEVGSNVQSTVRNSKRNAQLMDEAYADLVSMTPTEHHAELMTFGLVGADPPAPGETMGGELINTLAKLRVAREFGKLPRSI
jgi:hypothetical protein